ncbi:DUF7409 domain-containing protein [Halobacterium jilantaiense]|uniref:DUF7409 domain-containing protein n=1 Tax=Halobacterium jilantaiense TaxID=355548 RepID=A0A1I0NFH1_9EURY|nr:hypothetical protein [Halobacterium jilantaiense]SEV99517.1 hypothetical protein SAMN04487945_0801 [Halobacterium jilantaiense]
MAPDDAQDALRELQFVGPETAGVLAAANVTREDVTGKRVSHAQLVEYGVNPGVAARIRREHSLQWSFEGGEDLDQRAEQVRGLEDDERQWVAASYGDDAEADGSGDATAEEADWQAAAAAGGGEPAAAEPPGRTDDTEEEDGEAAWREDSWPNGRVDESFEREEAAWREASEPTPVTALDAVDADAAAMLSRAGITSVRSLATAHVDQVADSLGVSSDRVRALRDAAREHAQ